MSDAPTVSSCDCPFLTNFEDKCKQLTCDCPPPPASAHPLSPGATAKTLYSISHICSSMPVHATVTQSPLLKSRVGPTDRVMSSSRAIFGGFRLDRGCGAVCAFASFTVGVDVERTSTARKAAPRRRVACHLRISLSVLCCCCCCCSRLVSSDALYSVRSTCILTGQKQRG